MSTVVIQSAAKHTATLIFFHGLGDTGHGWASTIAEIRTPNMKVVCPTAPTMAVTLNRGASMPSWFDLQTLAIDGPEDVEGIKKATKNAHDLIRGEIQNGIQSNRIMIGGFSQGGALALYAALTFPEPLAGVMALSCWLPMAKTFPGAKLCPDTTPVLQCHGDCDPIMPYKFGVMSSSIVKTMLKNLQFKSYRGMSHSSSNEELEDMKKFLEEHVPRQ